LLAAAVVVVEEDAAVAVDALEVSVSEELAASLVDVVAVSSVLSAEVRSAAAFALLLVIVEARALASSEMETVSPYALELLVLLELLDDALRMDEEPELEDVESLVKDSKLSIADIAPSFVTPHIGRFGREFRAACK
jgi:hypothetical protein